MADKARIEEADVSAPADGMVPEVERVFEYEAAPAEEAVIVEPIAGETSVHRFRLSPEIAAELEADVVRIAEFWLNVADGDLAIALALACERLNLAAATASRGFLRGRQLNTATGF